MNPMLKNEIGRALEACYPDRSGAMMRAIEKEEMAVADLLRSVKVLTSKTSGMLETDRLWLHDALRAAETAQAAPLVIIDQTPMLPGMTANSGWFACIHRTGEVFGFTHFFRQHGRGEYLATCNSVRGRTEAELRPEPGPRRCRNCEVALERARASP